MTCGDCHDMGQEISELKADIAVVLDMLGNAWCVSPKGEGAEAVARLRAAIEVKED